MSAHPPSEPPLPPPCERRVVLYVEDHPVNALLMQAMFAKRPQIELRIATTGEAGYREAVEHPPDLLLLDLRLPDCHGTELLERLRGVPELAGVPAIAVTADDASDPRWAGFIEVWRKPVDVQVTLARLDLLLDLDAAADPPGDVAQPADGEAAGTALAAGLRWPARRGASRAVTGPTPFSSLTED